MFQTLRSKFQQRLRWQIEAAIPVLSPRLQQFVLYAPYQPDASAYTLPAHAGPQVTHALSPYPVPPPALWAGYGTSVEEYLTSGRDDVTRLRQLLAESGMPLEQCGRVLDLGCAAGRMLRWLADAGDVWGVDTWSEPIYWVQEHLPVHAVMTTTVPHLPFEDRAFGLIYAGSVWTHLDDLADAWLWEVHRLLRPGGRFYVTLNDRSAVKIFDGGGEASAYPGYYARAGGQSQWERFLTNVRGQETYRRFHRGEAFMASLGRASTSHVFWDVEAFVKHAAYGFRVCSITPAAYGHQTGVLLARR